MAIKKIGGGIDSNGGKNNIKINGQINSTLVSSDGYSYCVKVFTIETPNSMPYADNVATLSAYGRRQMLSLAF